MFYIEAIDAQAAYHWYEDKSVIAASDFMDELDDIVAKITKFPETNSKFYHSTRRQLMKRFPFSVVFRITNNTIQVLAVAHNRRKPRYWKIRLHQ